MPSVLRLLDANANRAREALRVLEDAARFGLNDSSLSASLKQLRHDLAAALASLPVSGVDLLAARDTPGDVGTSISTQSEMRRAGLPDIATAAAKRLQEALRSMEEAAKTLVPSEAPRRFEALRYRAYDAEQRLVLVLARPAPFMGFRLCVLITESLCAHHPWLEVARLAIEGGADCIQLREKGLETGEHVKRARALVEVAADNAAVIVNDRVDVAIATGAAGVHVGQLDIPAADARRLLNIANRPMLLGVSTSRVGEAVQAQSDGADYCGVGPMFPSSTKLKPRLAGPETLRDYLRRDPQLPPAIAISGIDETNIPRLLEAAQGRPFGVAISAAICASPDPAAACASILAALGSAAAPA